MRKLFTTSYKGRLPLTGQGEAHRLESGSRTLMIMFHFYFRHLCSQGRPQQAALGQALHQLRQAVSGEHNDCLEMYDVVYRFYTMEPCAVYIHTVWAITG